MNTFSELEGLTLSKVEITEEEMVFTTNDNQKYKLHHDQDCCESVAIEDVCGDLSDLIGAEILLAEEVSSQDNPEGIVPEHQDSFTWTFYKLATAKGGVTIRWYGESNGYYSESVDFVKL